MLSIVGNICILSCWLVFQSIFMNSFSYFMVCFKELHLIYLPIVQIRIYCTAIMPLFIVLAIFQYFIPIFQYITFACLGLYIANCSQKVVISQVNSYHRCLHYYHLKYKQNQHADPSPHAHTHYFHPPQFPDSVSPRKTNQGVVAINLKEQNVDK